MKPSDQQPGVQTLEEIHDFLDRRESEWFSTAAAPSSAAVRRRSEARLKTGYRQNYAVDADRILHSGAYTRYIDKTQVFSLISNDHISHRVLHVQLVAKIARTAGRFLGLNEDLLEAIALGHDIGHVPFGHDGEKILSDLCRSAGIGHFQHNVQSVHFLDAVERGGRGWNLCLQTLDGILCHDGEVSCGSLKPFAVKTFQSHAAEIESKVANPRVRLVPMTMEGCVVRMADTIGYIGRDIEDAVRLGLIKRQDIPRDCRQLLGETNGTIIHSLVTDLITSSLHRPHVAFSEPVASAVNRLKTFNLERIYMNPKIKKHLETVTRLFKILFESYFEDLEKGCRESAVFFRFLDNMSPDYQKTHSSAHIVRDFMAGMTDRYFLEQCPEADRRTLLEMYRDIF
ncbi:MAG: HD domain-containing protein [Desulfobacterales bacterium]|nr:HD domain-containing protein [Desulfobacterales bacterium]